MSKIERLLVLNPKKKSSIKRAIVTAVIGLSLVAPQTLLSNQKSEKVKADVVIAKGFEYLLKQKHKESKIWDNIPGDTATRSDLTLTSLAALAFMAEGSTHKEGKYKNEISTSLKYLKEKLTDVNKLENMNLRDYYRSHLCFQLPFVLLFLSELYNIEKNKEIEEVAQKIIRFLEDYQYKDGGWAYSKAMEPDLKKDSSGGYQTLLATTWTCVLSLSHAKKVGLDVPDKTISQGLMYIRNCSNRDGGFRYRANPKATKFEKEHSISYVGATVGAICTLLWAGDTGSTEFRKGCDYLANHMEDLIKDEEGEHYWFWLFFNAIALRHLEGERWEKWESQVRKYIVELQASDGHWKWMHMEKEQNHLRVKKLGRIFATSTALIILQVSKNKLFLLQKVK